MWGDGPPELVLLHGGAQNAHTWDTVALALDRPAGGHRPARPRPLRRRSRRRRSASQANADDVAVAIEALAPDAAAVVGMSLGGLTTHRRWPVTAPTSCARVVLVDVTPGVDEQKASRHHRLRRRAAELRQLRRAPGPHDRVQPDPHGVVAAPGHPPQRRCSSRTARGCGATPASGSARDAGDTTAPLHEFGAPVGRGVGPRRARSCSCGACARSRSSTTPTRPSCCAAAPARGSSTSTTPATACRATRPVELARLIESFVPRR